MYDSILRADENKEAKKSSKNNEHIGNEIQEEANGTKIKDYRDIAIGDEYVDASPDNHNNNSLKKNKKNIF